jgi:hypothetical protein
MDMTIKEFCNKHRACAEGSKWAKACGANTMQELWVRDDLRHTWRMWIMERKGVLSRNECIRFACWSVRQIWPMLTDARSRNAVLVTEAFLDGKATIKEVGDAAAAAYAYANANTANAAANAASYAAAYAANAAYAAYAANAANASYAANDANAANASYAAQDKWLIENTRPNFAKK